MIHTRFPFYSALGLLVGLALGFFFQEYALPADPLVSLYQIQQLVAGESAVLLHRLNAPNGFVAPFMHSLTQTYAVDGLLRMGLSPQAALGAGSLLGLALVASAVANTVGGTLERHGARREEALLAVFVALTIVGMAYPILSVSTAQQGVVLAAGFGLWGMETARKRPLVAFLLWTAALAWLPEAWPILWIFMAARFAASRREGQRSLRFIALGLGLLSWPLMAMSGQATGGLVSALAFFVMALLATLPAFNKRFFSPLVGGLGIGILAFSGGGDVAMVYPVLILGLGAGVCFFLFRPARDERPWFLDRTMPLFFLVLASSAGVVGTGQGTMEALASLAAWVLIWASFPLLLGFFAKRGYLMASVPSLVQIGFLLGVTFFLAPMAGAINAPSSGALARTQALPSCGISLAEALSRVTPLRDLGRVVVGDSGGLSFLTHPGPGPSLIGYSTAGGAIRDTILLDTSDEFLVARDTAYARSATSVVVCGIGAGAATLHDDLWLGSAPSWLHLVHESERYRVYRIVYTDVSP